MHSVWSNSSSVPSNFDLDYRSNQLMHTPTYVAMKQNDNVVYSSGRQQNI